MHETVDALGMKLRLPLLVALTLATALALAAPASAATAPALIQVAPGQSVADALNRVAPGGVVELLRGSHRPATIGPRSWSATVTLRPAAGAAGQVDTGELNLRGIEHLRIEGLATRGLVTIDGGRDVTVVSARPAGVLVKGDASDVDVLGNTIVGGWNGVTVQSWIGTARPHDVRIAGNVISGQENDNIQIGIAHDVTVEDNALLGTIANDNHNDGVQLMGGERVTVRNNRFSGQDQALMFKPETSLGEDSAIVDARIEGNLIDRTRDFGVILLGTTGTTVTDNTIYDTPKQALLFTGANTGAVVTGNVISVMYVERTATAPAVLSGNCIASGGKAGIGTITTDPGFVDRVDYRLPLLSPCAGLGAVLDLIG
jgi:parallel beta-helix repeat protein